MLLSPLDVSRAELSRESGGFLNAYRVEHRYVYEGVETKTARNKVTSG